MFHRPSWLTPAVLTIIVGGATMMSVAMGARQSFGLLIAPLSAQNGWPLATFSLAVALQNLMWGTFQPFTGAAADRWGAARVAAVGAVAYAAGLWLVVSGDPLACVLGLGLLSGLGMAATSHSVVLGPVGRAVAPEQRQRALGGAAAAGSVGMILLIPVADWLVRAQGATFTLLTLSALCLLSLPFALLMNKGERAAAKPAAALAGAGQSLREAVREAAAHSGYRYLTAGFFVCGFQLAFIAVHLPGYLQLCGMSAGAGATALLVIGLFNTLGTWAVGLVRWRAKHTLSAIYLLRAVAVLAFVLGPKTEWALLIFAAAMGLLWLSTVPPTSGLIAGVFGPRHMGTLFGIVFFSHQIGGFLGAWLGGVIYDRTLSYDAMWMVTAALGVAAALIHLPIADKTLRTQAA